jgi:hypothetical protein
LRNRSDFIPIRNYDELLVSEVISILRRLKCWYPESAFAYRSEFDSNGKVKFVYPEIGELYAKFYSDSAAEDPSPSVKNPYFCNSFLSLPFPPKKPPCLK